MVYKYDVALSFAGEDRELVEEFANILKKNNVKVFYDKFEEKDLWGKDLGIHFDFVYRKAAKYCIPFLSKHYKEKIWTNYELRNIISRAIENNEEYILPVRIDNTEIEGIRSTIHYISLTEKTPSELADLFLQKIKSQQKKSITEQFQEQHTDLIHIKIMTTFKIITGRRVAGVAINVTITNKIKGDNRYFYEPVFRLTKIFKGGDSFQLLNPDPQYKFPHRLEYGEEISIYYHLVIKQLSIWEQMNLDTEFYSICSTTIGEKYESNKLKISELVDAMKLIRQTK